MARFTRFLFVASLVLTWMTPALAQDDPGYIPEEVVTATEEDDTGWKPALSASANLSMSHNKAVVGNVDGLSLSAGLLVSGGLTYVSPKKIHEWRSSLAWGLGTTRTPALPKFVKSLDSLGFETMYLLHVPRAPWFGPFVGFDLGTSLFPTDDVRATDVTVQRVNVDGTSEADEVVTALEDIDLTGAFAPTSLRESVGVFARPVEKEPITMEIRTGIGAWETFVRDGYTISDNEETTEGVLVLSQLQDSVQLGGEFNLNLTGAIAKNVSYTGRAAIMMPFVHNVETDLSGHELFNYEFEVLIGVKLAEWASLDYQFKAFRVPLVYDGWQVQNGLLLSFTANLIREKKAVAAAE